MSDQHRTRLAGVCALLNEEGAKYVLVGATANLAMAYFFHGHARLAVETMGDYAANLRGDYRHDQLP